MTEYMLTTIDNPYSPVTQYEEWYAWDAQAGYHTPSYLARVVVMNDEETAGAQAEAIDSAMNEIISLHNDSFYKKVPVTGVV